MDSNLEADGTLLVTFGTTFGDVDSEGYVAPNGTVAGTEGTISIDGDYDFGACEGSGNWIDSAFGVSGTWTITKD